MELWEIVLNCVAVTVACLVCLLTSCAVVQSIRTIHTAITRDHLNLEDARSRHPLDACFYLLLVWITAVLFGICELQVLKEGKDAGYADNVVVVVAIVIMCFLVWVVHHPRPVDNEELERFRALMRRHRREHLGVTQTLCDQQVENREDILKNRLFHRRLEHDDNDQTHSPALEAEQDPELQQDNGDVLVRMMPCAETSLRSLMRHAASMECSICLDHYEVGETICWAKSDDCNHVFHEDCILRWLEQHDQCPLCRVNLLANLEVV